MSKIFNYKIKTIIKKIVSDNYIDIVFFYEWSTSKDYERKIFLREVSNKKILFYHEYNNLYAHFNINKIIDDKDVLKQIKLFTKSKKFNTVIGEIINEW